jgi:hypothetical protein
VKFGCVRFALFVVYSLVVDKKASVFGLLLVLALVLVASLPFLTRPGLPRDTDTELHVFRAAEVSACWQEGVVYPRWAPDFYYGYGYPIFNYYAPLTYHLASLIALLPGVSIVAGVKALFVLALLLGGVGTYFLTRDLWGDLAGVIGAAVFLFSPYILFVDTHARGDLAEHFAICLLPPALFFLRALVARGGKGLLLMTTILIAALPMSHNLLGPVGLVFLLAALAWQMVVEGCRNGVGRGLLAFALAAALSAVFWLPMLLELSAVQLTVVGPGHFDFRNHFVSLWEVLAPSKRVDLGAIAPLYRHNLGLAQWMLALTGAISALRQNSPHRRTLLFFVLSAIGVVFLLTPASLFLWELLPWLEYLQFPWRLLGTAALAIAVPAAASAVWLPRLPDRRWRSVVFAAALLFILVAALPVMYPHQWEADFGDTSPAGIVAFELEGKVIGTTSTGDFLPQTVEVTPRPEDSLVASYFRPGPIDKVNRATLPDHVTVQVLSHGPTHDRFYTSSPSDFYLRVYTFLFPGWHAYIDGEEVAIDRGRPEGAMHISVPAGVHQVLFRLEDTPARRAGWMIAAAGLFVLVLALAVVRPVDATRNAPAPLKGQEFAWGIGAVLVLVLFKSVVADSLPGWFRYVSEPGEADAAQYERSPPSVLDGKVEFLGFDLPRSQVRSGETFELILYWRALQPLDTNLQSFAHVTHPAAISWGQSDALNPGGLPTTRWPTDKYVWDIHRIGIRPGTPPGEYALEVGLYTMADGRRLPVLNAEGEPAGGTVVLDVPIEVLPAREPSPIESLEMDREVWTTYDNQISLLGYATPTTTTDAPGFIHLTLFWRAEQRRPDDLVVTVAVVDPERNIAAIVSGPPANGRYPTGEWSRGEVVRDAYAFWLSEEFEPGSYTVGVVVHRGDQPITAQGMEDPFLELYALEVERWEE